MTIVKVATINPVKVEAFKEAFERYFEDVKIITFDVKSGVPEQPTNDEVFEGAKNRLEKLKDICDDDYDYVISCESGLINLSGYWFNVQVVIIEGKDGKNGVGISQGYQIPPKYVEEIINTKLGSVLDRIFEGKGGIRVLTRNQFTRKDLIKDATIMAFARVLNGDIW